MANAVWDKNHDNFIKVPTYEIVKLSRLGHKILFSLYYGNKS